MQRHDIIALGASAGGVEVLCSLVAELPAELPATLLVVLHVSATATSILPTLLNRSGRLLALHPTDRAPVRHGCIYVAPPDHHLLVEGAVVRVMRGPRENRHRPAIDPLFRSVAAVYGPRAVGIVLSGTLDDGTAGLVAIKRRGGIAVVQDPSEATYSSMPESALASVAVDYCLPVAGIAQLLLQVTATPAVEAPAAPRDMVMELRSLSGDVKQMERDERPGRPSVYSCPECGGVLWEIDEGGVWRFRCRVGHAFSQGSMLDEQSEAAERALWMALKTLEERASLLRRMIKQAKERVHSLMADRLSSQLGEAEAGAEVLRGVLLRTPSSYPAPPPPDLD